MFRRRQGVQFFTNNREVQRAYGRAAAMASARSPDRAQGTDSLDLLIAATEAKSVRQLLRRLDVDPGTTVRLAEAARVPIHEPGLTPDAMRVAEAVAHRALVHRRNANAIDLLIALAETPGPACDLLADQGLDEGRLGGLIA
jgi:hypothetical protein